MKTLFNSLAGAAALAFIHFLLELWRAFLDFVYVLPDYAGGSTGTMALISLGYSLVFGGWLLALNGARREKRAGAITAVLFGLLFWVGVDLSTVFFYCPGGCEEVVFDIGTYTAILAGAASLYGLLRNLRNAQG